MTKDEMIEKMAKVLCDNDKRCDECISRLLLPCGYKSYCKKLYNAGYRKVGEDEIVINRSRYKELTKDYSRNNDAYYRGYSVAKQQTARGILQELKEILKRDDLFLFEKAEKIEDLLPRLEIKYGIELE